MTEPSAPQGFSDGQSFQYDGKLDSLPGWADKGWATYSAGPALASTGSRYGRGEAPRIRLMIVDDSMVARAVLSRMVESDSAFEIAAVAGTAEDAIDALNSSTELVPPLPRA